MDPNLIAAVVLFGPGAVALPILTAACIRGRRAAEAECAMLADLHATQAAATHTPGPDGPKEPLPVPAETPVPVVSAIDSAPVAPVIDINTRRRAA